MSFEILLDTKPEESFASAVSRYHWSFGGARTQDTWKLLFDDEPGRLTQVIPTQLWRVAERMPKGTISNVQSLIEKLTLFPLYLIFHEVGLPGIQLGESAGSQGLYIPKRVRGVLDTKICHS